MSTEPPSPPDPPTTETPTTAVAARGRADPWTDDDATTAAAPTKRVQRQFEPYSLARMRNLMDDDNAYCH
jgi:hypothetical protein